MSEEFPVGVFPVRPAPVPSPGDLSLCRMPVAPPSCCLVAFPPRAKDGLVVFGKNSARPRDEVQEVVYFSAANHEPESKVEVSGASHSLDSQLFCSLGFAQHP